MKNSEVEFILQQTPSLYNLRGGSMVILGFFVIIGAFLVPAYQGLMWLYTGEWKPLPMDVVLRSILPQDFYVRLHVWLADTTSWVGVKKIVGYAAGDMPLFAFLLFLG